MLLLRPHEKNNHQSLIFITRKKVKTKMVQMLDSKFNTIFGYKLDI